MAVPTALVRGHLYTLCFFNQSSIFTYSTPYLFDITSMSSRILAWTAWLHAASLPVILDAGVGEELKRRTCINTREDDTGATTDATDDTGATIEATDDTDATTEATDDTGANTEATGDTDDTATFASASLWASSLLVTPEGRTEISRLAREYLEAGADILTTATYQATPELFAAEFPDIDMEEECPFRASVTLLDVVRKEFWSESKNSHANTRRYPAIAASIGPMASWMDGESEFEGRYSSGVTFQDFCASHKATALKFVSDGVSPDVLAYETVPSGLEAEAIASIMSNTWELSRIPYWISFQCKDHCRLANGDTVMEVVQNVLRYSRSNLVGLGVNCVDIQHAAALCSNIDRAIRCFRKFNVVDHKNLSILVYPNNGMPKIVSRKMTIVGACCGLGPTGLQEWISARSERPS